jgi:hypothetical protein
VNALEILSAGLTLAVGREDYPKEMSEHPFEDIHRPFGSESVHSFLCLQGT